MVASAQPSGPPEVSGRESGLALSAWLALLLAATRSILLLALEFSHHGEAEVAWLRLAHAFPLLACVAFALGCAGALAASLLELLTLRRIATGSLRVLALGLFAGLAFLFLSGWLDDDRSRRIGTDTPVGIGALVGVALVALALALFFFLAPLRSRRAPLVRSWRASLPPFALLTACFLYLEVGRPGLGALMPVNSVLQELHAETWEVLRARKDCAPTMRVLCPSAQYKEEGAGRPTLVLAPPARVRRRLADDAGACWLRAGVGIDHSVSEDVGERYAGHRVRFTARLDGRQVFQAEIPVQGSSTWSEMGGSAGLPVGAGAVLELETVLLDPGGREVQPADPLLVGFGGLELEHRARLARTHASRERPNIVLLLIDTLRADRTSAYGYPRDTSPHLAALARRGVLFEETCATSSWTWPSTASILTGLQPEEHGVQGASSSFLPERLDTLAEALQRVGFTTACWSGSPLIVPDKNFDQGFEFFDASAEGRMRRSDLVMPGALEWLDGASDWRFFLYLHLMEPHAPFVPLDEGRARFSPEVPLTFDPRKIIDYSWELRRAGFTKAGEARTAETVSAEEQRWISDLYDGCVWSADYWLGRLLARLEELDLSENTIVVVTSDHGEELFDHGLLGHAHSLQRELVRVPLVIAGPGIPSGTRVHAALSSVGLGPTLARLGGTAIDGLEHPLDLLSASEGESSFFSTQQGWWNGVGGQPLYGLRRGTTVLHFAPEGRPWDQKSASGGETHLYDLATDPGEHDDLSVRDPARALDLRAELLERLKEFGRQRSVNGGVADEATLDMLRDLGYVK